ncbi:diphthamide biosynthesis protein [Lentinula edodes]|uniref:2-(3-amino-3-carboxypropyl)histidine synthase subunit 2 n=1 Tax=Lentinula edodes TaxID=5353 RepID=A0A1Q3ESP9_LENED|nr:diphthamide biosynthesis protein [Lentinula edodes]
MSVENTAFSASGEEVIARSIDIEVDDTADKLKSLAEFDAFYEIERTAREIEEDNFKRVALQFPDELLHDSTHPMAVAVWMKWLLSISMRMLLCIMVMLDISASSNIRLWKEDRRCGRLRKSNRSKKIVLRHDVAYTHQAGRLVDRFREALTHFDSQLAYAEIPDKLLPPDHPESSRTLPEEVDQDCTIFYVGDESLGLTNLLMTHSSCDVYQYSPTSQTSCLASGRTNKLLMRRYAAMQKGRDADVFGILVGTLGVASYLPLIKHIRTLLNASHKKSYTISVGKLNPSKLANFMEIECFVLVACPENSLIDAKDFYRPIITPYELEVALQAEQSWTGKYILDFEKLLAEYGQGDKTEIAEGNDEDKDEDAPVFSLVTGKYRHAKQFGPISSETNSMASPSSSAALIQRNQDNALSLLSDSAAAQFLQSRTYQGLDPRLGQDAPSALEQGRSGIARGYGGSTLDHKS